MADTTKKESNANIVDANSSVQKLRDDISHLIEQSRQNVVSLVNSALTLLFWDNGKQIVSTLATQLHQKYGRGFEEKNLRRMLKFADLFSKSGRSE